MINWYEKCMPRVKDVKPYLSVVLEQIKKIGGVDKVYIWGSYATNYDNPNFRIKDVDIIVKIAVNSQDLISVDENIVKKICTKRYLEKEGYSQKAVELSKEFLKFNKYNIDHWAISCDKKLLHWGPIAVDKKESDDISKEAENYATSESGHDRKRINKSSEEDRKSWYKHCCSYMNRYFNDMPSGWYKSEEENVEEILKDSILI